jgi:hypothetical protein
VKNLTVQDRDTLESIVDRYSLRAIVEGLSEISHLKAAHIRENWQDDSLAKMWERVSKIFDKFSHHKGLRQP